MRLFFVVLFAGAVSLTNASRSKGGSSESPPVDSRGAQVAEIASSPVSTSEDWVRRADSTRRAKGAAVWDSVRNQIVIYGGYGNDQCCGDCWYGAGSTLTWDGSAQTMLASANNGPGGRYDAKMAFDEHRGVAVTCGNEESYDALCQRTFDISTWEWNGTAWTIRSAADPRGLSQFDNELFYDVSRGQVISYGGYDFSCFNDNPPCQSVGPNHDMWAWNGNAWTHVSTSYAPTVIYAFLALDEARGVTVMFGGVRVGDVTGNGYESDETWEWDGTSWTQRFPPTSPPARDSHRMAYDSVRHAMVLTGGEDASGIFLNDTWEYDGTNWTEVSVAHPYDLARELHFLVFDKSRGVLVLYGGVAQFPGGQFVGEQWDTWELHRSEITLQPQNVTAGLGSNVQLVVGVQATSLSQT